MLRIRELRLENGISQKELAEKFSMSQGNLCDWEKGRSEPDVSSLVALADFFGVSVDYLVGRTDSYPDGTEAFDAEMSAEKRFLLETVKSADEDTVHVLASVAKAISRH